ncbi:MAG: hypothetical protein QM703_28805 [Gemmatales bacterium]
MAHELIDRYLPEPAAEAAMQQMVTVWDRLEDRLQVLTPDPWFDLMMNHWLLYQVLSCRMWGRSAFYQSGGAFGFRDQLQDAMALVYSKPELVRAHLLKAASRQFLEGDVQHWWHEPRGFGVRTQFSDDFLWLPFVTAHYVEITGDLGVLDEIVPFLIAEPLPDGVHERYGPATISETSASLYEHCVCDLQAWLETRYSWFASDGLWRLERWHEPRGHRRQRGKHLGRLVSNLWLESVCGACLGSR